MFNLFKKYWALIILMILSVVFFIGFVILLIYNSLNTAPKENLPTPIPLPTDRTKEYSNLNSLIPGKSTIEDVKATNGAPQSISTFGGDTYLYYPTPLEKFRNTVLIKNGVVYYAIENVFGEYRGSFLGFVNKYGESPLKMYAPEDPFTWYVYPEKGFAFQSDEQDILTMVYFISMSEEEFIRNVAPDLKLNINRPETEGD